MKQEIADKYTFVLLAAYAVTKFKQLHRIKVISAVTDVISLVSEESAPTDRFFMTALIMCEV